MNPQELSLFVTAVANGLYEVVPPTELSVLAAVFDQLADTLATLAAQAALLEEKRGS